MASGDDAAGAGAAVLDPLDQAFAVADDGSGMGADELPLALERHATSKIDSLDDLDRLRTLGFRGEALPSIAAVSRLTITSRLAADESAAFVQVEGGAPVESGRVARAPGTTVEVRDLFFNTPARRKFLHSPAGELRAAIRMLECYGLAYPETAFRLVVAMFQSRLTGRVGRRVNLRYLSTLGASVTLDVLRGSRRIARIRGSARLGANAIAWNGKRGRRAAVLYSRSLVGRNSGWRPAKRKINLA